MDEILVEQIRCLNQISAWETFGMHAVAVVSKGNPGEYDNNPTVIEYQARGYELVDANMFGQGGETGEILIFNKVEDEDVKKWRVGKNEVVKRTKHERSNGFPFSKHFQG